MNWLKKRRQEIHITQAELAIRLQLAGYDCSSQAISHWENGRWYPPMRDKDFRAIMSRALEMSEKEMLLLAGYDVDGEDADDIVNRATVIISHLPTKVRQHALEYLQMLESQHYKKVLNE